MLCSPGKNCHK